MMIGMLLAMMIAGIVLPKEENYSDQNIKCFSGSTLIREYENVKEVKVESGAMHVLENGVWKINTGACQTEPVVRHQEKIVVP